MASKTVITTKRERINPALAAKYLNRNTCNRPLRQGVVEKYAADMKAGNWTECAADIVIYDTHEIGDGQHRLYAIIESGTTQEFFVKRNFPKDAALNVDTGVARSFRDNSKIAGDEPIANQAISVAKWVQAGSRKAPEVRNLSFSQQRELYDRHKDAVSFAIAFMGRKRRAVFVSPVVAAMARAWYVEKDKNKLTRFGEVLAEGIYEGDKELAAVTLRNYLLSSALNAVSGEAYENELFRKAQNAIKHFMTDKPLRVIKAVKDETYPLSAAPKSKQAA